MHVNPASSLACQLSHVFAAGAFVHWSASFVLLNFCIAACIILCPPHFAPLKIPLIGLLKMASDGSPILDVKSRKTSPDHSNDRGITAPLLGPRGTSMIKTPRPAEADVQVDLDGGDVDPGEQGLLLGHHASPPSRSSSGGGRSLITIMIADHDQHDVTSRGGHTRLKEPMASTPTHPLQPSEKAPCSRNLHSEVSSTALVHLLVGTTRHWTATQTLSLDRMCEPGACIVVVTLSGCID